MQSHLYRKKTNLFFFVECAVAQYEPDEGVKETKFANLKQDVIPYYLEKLESIAKQNNGYLALGRVCNANSNTSLLLNYSYVPDFDSDLNLNTFFFFWFL